MNTSTTGNINNLTIKLEKVAADYKLQPSQLFLLQGRVNKKFPLRPYFHVIRSNQELAATMPEELQQLPAAIRAAIAKLWSLAIIELLKDKAATLTPGASITTSINAATILTYIEELGNRERSAISGEELDEFTSSYAMEALTSVYNWNATQQAKVHTALRQYAAPAHRKQQKDAAVLLARLEALPSLLLGDDAEEDATITTIYQWLHSKLTRDAIAQAVDLSESI